MIRWINALRAEEAEGSCELSPGGRGRQARVYRAPGRRAAARALTFPFATALHLNLRLASARNRASCSSLAKVQCLFWLLLWYIGKSEARPRESVERRPRTVQNLNIRHLSHLQDPAEAKSGRPGAGAMTSTSRDNPVPGRVSGAD